MAIQRLQRQVPACPPLGAVQWSPQQQEQRYVVAEAGEALVVAFLGTKRAADHLVNLQLRPTPFLANSSSASSSGANSRGSGRPAVSAAHSGYQRRATAVPAEQLYQLARLQGKRLVLAGGCARWWVGQVGRSCVSAATAAALGLAF